MEFNIHKEEIKNSIIQNIKSLPVLSDTVLKIQHLNSNKDSSISDLTKVVESDPLLTTNILKSANSPLYGFSREIKNISQAVALFGKATVYGFALSSAIKQSFKIDLSPYGITEQQFLDISTSQSSFIFKWYSKVNRDMLELLQPIAFVMEIGKIIIANQLIEMKVDKKFKEELHKISTLEALEELETNFVGFTSEEITGMIFDHWKLEAEFGEVIKHLFKIDSAMLHSKSYIAPLYVTKKMINIFHKYDRQCFKQLEQYFIKHKLNFDTFIDIVDNHR